MEKRLNELDERNAKQQKELNDFKEEFNKFKGEYDQLVEMGCNLFQGYYFAKPMPVDEFEQFAENNLKEKKS